MKTTTFPFEMLAVVLVSNACQVLTDFNRDGKKTPELVESSGGADNASERANGGTSGAVTSSMGGYGAAETTSGGSGGRSELISNGGSGGTADATVTTGTTCMDIRNGIPGNCSALCPCTSGEGPCQADEDCSSGLKCDASAGAKFGIPGKACIPPHCTNDVIDLELGETSRDCGGECGGPTIEALPGVTSWSCATAVSSDGEVVGGYAKTGAVIPAYQSAIWLKGANSPLILPGTMSEPTSANRVSAVSANGQVAVGFVIVGGGGRPFYTHSSLWSKADDFGVTKLALPPGGTTYPTDWANAVSGDGLVVVGRASGAMGESQPYRWTAAGGYELLGWPQGTSNGKSGEAMDVSADGIVVVGTSMNGAFRWTASGGIIGLGSLKGATSAGSATSVSANGLVVVGSATNAQGNTEAFRWTEATGMVGIGYIPNGSETPHSNPKDVSGDGGVIVGISTSKAFYWDFVGGIRTLSAAIVERGYESPMDDWVFSEVGAITPDGRTIVGCGTVPGSDVPQAWRVRLP